MDDTITAHAIVPANVTGSVLSSTARSFPRVASPKMGEALRQSLHVDTRSPCVLRIAHVPRGQKSTNQLSLFETTQTLARLDAQNNVVGYDIIKVSTKVTLPAGVTLAEYQAVSDLHHGALLENSGSIRNALFNGEQ
jgi:hypothetical protein